MWLVSLHQMQEMYGGSEPQFHRLEPFCSLRERNELTRWQDLPADASVLFLSHEWCGWNHPDPNATQLKTFLNVIDRLQSGEIDRVTMRSLHKLIYKQDYVKTAQELHFMLKATFVWIDWCSIPVCKEDKVASHELAVRSIPSYIERADIFVVGTFSLSLSLCLRIYI